MQVSSGRPHMLTSNQRGRGNDPVTVLGRIRSAVAVNMGSSGRHCTSTHVRPGISHPNLHEAFADAKSRAKAFRLFAKVFEIEHLSQMSDCMLFR